MKKIKSNSALQTTSKCDNQDHKKTIQKKDAMNCLFSPVYAISFNLGRKSIMIKADCLY